MPRFSSITVVVALYAACVTITAAAQDASPTPPPPDDPQATIQCFIHTNEQIFVNGTAYSTREILNQRVTDYYFVTPPLRGGQETAERFYDLVPQLYKSYSTHIACDPRPEEGWRTTGTSTYYVRDWQVTVIVRPLTEVMPEWKPIFEVERADNLSTAVQRHTLNFVPMPDSRFRQGYGNASIDLAYRFMVCAGEIHFAYSLDRQSLTHSDRYFIRPDDITRSDDVVVPDSEPPAPLTFPLDAEIWDIRSQRLDVPVKDAIAGEALGMGCFTGQSKKLTTVTEILGPGATPEAAKAFIEGLRIKVIADIPFALTHPQPIDLAARAAREAQLRAEREAREEQARAAERARELAERQALQSEAREVYRQMLATGQMSVTVDALLFPYVQQIIAEEAARNDAQYASEVAALEASAAETDRLHEAEMARWRAEVAENDRKMAEWRAEVCRIDRTKCAAE